MARTLIETFAHRPVEWLAVLSAEDHLGARHVPEGEAVRFDAGRWLDWYRIVMFVVALAGAAVYDMLPDRGQLCLFAVAAYRTFDITVYAMNLFLVKGTPRLVSRRAAAPWCCCTIACWS